jgi:predicted CoA-binding protein
MFQNPSIDEIVGLLQRSKRIAVVGLSPKANRPSHGVAKSLQAFGYTIVPVRPLVDSVLGEQAYADLYTVPGEIDLVDVFRAPEYVDAIVDACIELHIPAIWLQDGVINEPAALRAQAAGIMVIMDRCIYRDYRQFFKASSL